jgi:hypothetical protein
MVQELHFHREDIVRIQAILDKFPNIDSFQLCIEAESGIGTTATMSFHHTANDIPGTFTIPVWGVESW